MTASDQIVYTICGARVDADPPESWSIACASMPAPDADFAISLMTRHVTGDASDDGRLISVGFALASVHPGDVEVIGPLNQTVMRPPLTYQEIDRELELHANSPVQRYTICGFDRRTFATLSYWVEGSSWLLAYDAALAATAADRYDLRYCGAHPGWVERVDGYRFADPLADNEAAMALHARDTWGVQP